MPRGIKRPVYSAAAAAIHLDDPSSPFFDLLHQQLFDYFAWLKHQRSSAWLGNVRGLRRGHVILEAMEHEFPDLIRTDINNNSSSSTTTTTTNTESNVKVDQIPFVVLAVQEYTRLWNATLRSKHPEVRLEDPQQPEQQQQQDSSVDLPKSKKRKRGRPPKSPDVPLATLVKPKKRKRGRPRKNESGLVASTATPRVAWKDFYHPLKAWCQAHPAMPRFFPQNVDPELFDWLETQNNLLRIPDYGTNRRNMLQRLKLQNLTSLLEERPNEKTNENQDETSTTDGTSKHWQPKPSAKTSLKPAPPPPSSSLAAKKNTAAVVSSPPPLQQVATGKKATEEFGDPTTIGERYDVVAPAGKLGLVIGCSPSVDVFPLIGGWPEVRAIMDTGVIANRGVQVGDRVLSVNGVDCTTMTPLQVSKLIGQDSDMPGRVLVFAMPVGEERYDVVAPPGKLGLVIGGGSPSIVADIKDTSVLVDRRVQVGDRLLSIDGENCAAMQPTQVLAILSRKLGQPARVLVFARRLLASPTANSPAAADSTATLTKQRLKLITTNTAAAGVATASNCSATTVRNTPLSPNPTKKVNTGAAAADDSPATLMKHPAADMATPSNRSTTTVRNTPSSPSPRKVNTGIWLKRLQQIKTFEVQFPLATRLNRSNAYYAVLYRWLAKMKSAYEQDETTAYGGVFLLTRKKKLALESLRLFAQHPNFANYEKELQREATRSVDATTTFGTSSRLTWEERYLELLEYCSKHPDRDYISKDENPILLGWFQQQVYKIKSPSIDYDSEQQCTLESLGLRTGGTTEGEKSFLERYQQLVDYQNTFPDRDYLDQDYDPKLFKWFRDQLRNMSKSTTTTAAAYDSERRKRLEKVNLKLQSKATKSTAFAGAEQSSGSPLLSGSWKDRYDELVEFSSRSRFLGPTDTTIPNARQLYGWLMREKYIMRNNADYDPQKRQALEKLQLKNLMTPPPSAAAPVSTNEQDEIPNTALHQSNPATNDRGTDNEDKGTHRDKKDHASNEALKDASISSKDGAGSTIAPSANARAPASSEPSKELSGIAEQLQLLARFGLQATPAWQQLQQQQYYLVMAQQLQQQQQIQQQQIQQQHASSLTTCVPSPKNAQSATPSSSSRNEPAAILSSRLDQSKGAVDTNSSSHPKGNKQYAVTPIETDGQSKAAVDTDSSSPLLTSNEQPAILSPMPNQANAVDAPSSSASNLGMGFLQRLFGQEPSQQNMQGGDAACHSNPPTSSDETASLPSKPPIQPEVSLKPDDTDTTRTQDEAGKKEGISEKTLTEAMAETAKEIEQQIGPAESEPPSQHKGVGGNAASRSPATSSDQTASFASNPIQSDGNFKPDAATNNAQEAAKKEVPSEKSPAVGSTATAMEIDQEARPRSVEVQGGIENASTLAANATSQQQQQQNNLHPYFMRQAQQRQQYQQQYYNRLYQMPSFQQQQWQQYYAQQRQHTQSQHNPQLGMGFIQQHYAQQQSQQGGPTGNTTSNTNPFPNNNGGAGK
jgi:hypothetical protein